MLLQRLRSEEGFGLIELLISMVVLNVGILALMAAFNSGALALRRASELSTAAAIADMQMELYRGSSTPRSPSTRRPSTAYTGRRLSRDARSR